MPSDDLYDARIVDKCVIGDRKCYFAESNMEPYSLFSDDDIKKSKENLVNSELTALGFGIIWKTDMLLADVRKNLRGFENLGRYEEVQHGKTLLGHIEEVYSMCQLEAEIFGEESKALRVSSSKEGYLMQMCLQKRFKQYVGFEL